MVPRDCYYRCLWWQRAWAAQKIFSSLAPLTKTLHKMFVLRPWVRGLWCSFNFITDAGDRLPCQVFGSSSRYPDRQTDR